LHKETAQELVGDKTVFVNNIHNWIYYSILDKYIYTLYKVCMNTQIVNISLPQKLLDLVDAVAEKEARTRSDLFREAIRQYVISQKRWDSILEYGASKANSMQIAKEDVEDLIHDFRQGK
jgi:CopG family transcriptional regulator/antitoxin EndoAI